MYSLVVRLFNIDVLVLTDVEAAYRHITHSFRTQSGGQSKLLQDCFLTLTLLGPNENNTRYRLYFDSVLFVERLEFADALLQLEHSLLQRSVKEGKGITVFHAAWVSLNHQAILLIGESGTGKTSLCHQLLERGFHYGSDEAAGFQNRTGFLLPFHRKLLIKPQSPIYTDDLQKFNADNFFWSVDRRAYLVPPGHPARWASAGPYQLFFVFPHYDSLGPGCECKELSTWESLQLLLLHCFQLKSMDQVLFRRLLGALEPRRCLNINYSDAQVATNSILRQMGKV
jgi:hypothetical protein